MFPSAHSMIYRNEEGEVLGWDNPPIRDEYEEEDFYDESDDWCEECEECEEDEEGNRWEPYQNGQTF